VSTSLTVIDDCWNRIGVRGNRSCPELKFAIHCQNCNVFGSASKAFFDRARDPEYEREATDLVAEASNTRLESTCSVVIFALGQELFALDTRSFVEVTEPRRIHRVAHRTDRVFAGLVNIHGHLELCVSLAGLLALEGARTADVQSSSRARMLVVEDDRRRRWVFAANAVLGVQRVLQTSFGEVPATLVKMSSNLVSKVIEWEEQRVGYLDTVAFFGALDRSVR
jgi:chemotaxis-related protein WspD